MLIYKLVCVYFLWIGQGASSRRVKKIDGLKAKRILVHQIRRADQICYDIVGCFDLPRKLSPLHKGPESPALINTKFFLFRNDLKFYKPQRLYYEDNGRTLNESKFNANQHVKVIVHGYLGSWRDEGAQAGAKLYTQLCKCNVILLDWETGARGPSYANAAANTEIVGRQLGVLLLQMIDQGLDPRKIHIVGFSLGAHVAGCASELLKNNGLIIGRITGLDAASPLFRNNHIRDKSKKLDRSDALLVDAVHTDSSPFFTDGFGLLEPIGHVDFFPNGGFEQPGCSDRMASVLVTHLERTLTKDSACSHVRAWELFRESLEIQLKKAPSCSFVAYKCGGGLGEYRHGECFPSVPDSFGGSNELGKMGEDVQGEGIMYLATQNKYPFCGTQMQVGIHLKSDTDSLNGMVHCNLRQGNSSINFEIPMESGAGPKILHGLSVMDPVTMSHDLNVKGSIMYHQTLNEKHNGTVAPINPEMLAYKVTLRDTNGNSWSMCTNNVPLQAKPTHLTLNSGNC